MNETYRTACRYKDGTKNLIDVSNVEDFHQALLAVKDQPKCTAAVVLVPKDHEHFEMEPQTA